MTKLHINLQSYIDDGREGIEGRIRFTPTRRHTDDTAVILPNAFDVWLEHGEATVEIEPSVDRGWAWRITELPMRGSVYEHIVEIPDSTATIEYVDLEEINPDTLIPDVLKDGPLLRYHICDSDDEAYEYSVAHPNIVVLYKEEGA